MGRNPLRWPASLSSADALSILDGTPFNVLVADAAARTAIGDAASKRKIAVVAAESLAAAPVAKAPWKAPGETTVVTGQWPGVRLGPGARAAQGPTGTTWVDSNGWVARLAHQAAPEKKEVWIASTPAGSGPRPEDYELAIADAAVFDARWIVTLDDAIATGIAAKNDDALKVWQRIVQAAAFFEKRREWDEWTPVAKLGILSSFSGPDQALAHEVLNLAMRRHLAYRILPNRGEPDLSGLAAVLYVSNTEPEPPLRASLMDWVNRGGLLIVPQALAAMAPTGAKEAAEYPRHRAYESGKGRIAVATEPLKDPYLLASDAHLIFGRRHDVYRLYNAGSMNGHVTRSPDGRRTVVQVLNYAKNSAGHEVSLQLTEKHAKALMHEFGKEAAPVELQRIDTGSVEIALPRFPVYLAFELMN